MFPIAEMKGSFLAMRSLVKGAIRKAGSYSLFGLLCACIGSSPARGSVGVVLDESLDESMDWITGSGHSAVYFSDICPDSPVRLRLCRPGETGSVMSTYVNIGEDQPFEWNVAPLNIYLFGVEDPRNRPIFGSKKIKHLLEERYRERYLSGYCASTACRTSRKAEWREMVAATLARSVYILVVDTTEEQDRKLISEFNESANQNHFNGFTHNCANFTRRVINAYFPHAVSPDYLNDFGMTSPKAVARTFTRYALHHPECSFRVLHFAQVPGTIKRSSEMHAGTEQLYCSKKLLVPMLVFADHELPFLAATYLLTGRFSPERAFEQHPAAEPLTGDPAPHPGEQAAALPDERKWVTGTSAEWAGYRRAFGSIVEENKSVFDQQGLVSFLKRLDEAGTAYVDSDGSVWIELSEGGESLKVGASANNALIEGSNAQLAYELLLARTSRLLRSPKHSRETMPEFKQDWVNLERASEAVGAAPTRRPTPGEISHAVLMRTGSTD